LTVRIGIPSLRGVPRKLPELLTTQQIAELFAVDPATVNRWARDKVLTAIRLPGMRAYRFRRDEVERLLDHSEDVA
jgi:excisionase family DNA binding protein